MPRQSQHESGLISEGKPKTPDPATVERLIEEVAVGVYEDAEQLGAFRQASIHLTIKALRTTRKGVEKRAHTWCDRCNRDDAPNWHKNEAAVQYTFLKPERVRSVSTSLSATVCVRSTTKLQNAVKFVNRLIAVHRRKVRLFLFRNQPILSGFIARRKHGPDSCSSAQP